MMNVIRQELVGVIDDLSDEKLKVQWYIAQFLMDTDELTIEEMSALHEGMSQIERGEFVPFEPHSY